MARLFPTFTQISLFLPYYVVTKEGHFVEVVPLFQDSDGSNYYCAEDKVLCSDEKHNLIGEVEEV